MTRQASSEEELYSWMVPLRVLVGSHNLVRTGAAGSMCYVDVARRVELVNMRNRSVFGMPCVVSTTSLSARLPEHKQLFDETVLYSMMVGIS